jgi:hypothetical protein
MCFRGPAKSLKMKECQLPPDRDALSQAHASPSYTQSLRAAICRQAVELRKQDPAKSLLSGVAIEPHESEKPKAPDVGLRVRRQGLEVNRENSRERRANLRSLARQFQPSLGGREQCL